GLQRSRNNCRPAVLRSTGAGIALTSEHMEENCRRDLGARGAADQNPGGGTGGLSGSAFALRGPCDSGEHRSGVAVQDLLARFLADLRFRERLPGPVAAELGA